MHLTMNMATQSRLGHSDHSTRPRNKVHLDQRQHQYYPYMPRVTTNQPAKPTKPAISGKSKPVDPNDLRRRLLVVVAERDALRESRRRALAAQQQAEADAARKQQEAEAKKSRETNVLSAIRPKSRKQSKSNLNGYKDASGLSSSSSKLARKFFDVEVGSEQNGYARQATKGLSSRPQAPYIPQEAAAQFSETTTSDTMQDPSSLSLRRSLSNRELLNESVMGKNRHHAQRGAKDSVGGLAGIREDGQQRRRRSSLGYSPNSNGSDESLMAPQRLQTAPHDYRMVDWSQSDETQRGQESTQTTSMLAKRRSSFFLRKAESVWALRGKLVGKSGSGGTGRDDNGGYSHHRKTPSAVSEGAGYEKASNAKSQEATSPISPRSRLGFISKLKY